MKPAASAFVLLLLASSATSTTDARAVQRAPLEPVTISFELANHCNTNGHPVVNATLTSAAGIFEDRSLLAIGSSLPLALHSPFVTKHGLRTAAAF